MGEEEKERKNKTPHQLEMVNVHPIQNTRKLLHDKRRFIVRWDLPIRRSSYKYWSLNNKLNYIESSFQALDT